jgi:sugar phosphate isomerase/epimerase
MFSLGYSTYATKMLDPFVALPMIKQMGYNSIEICLSDDCPTYPEKFSLDEQDRLKDLCQELGFSSPAFFGLIDVCNLDNPEELKKTLEKFEMSNKIHYDDYPILITTVIGHSAPDWDVGKNLICEKFIKLADMASDYNVVIAVEPHAGTDFETPDKAVWLMKQTDHKNLKLDMDISHFFVEGFEIDYSVDVCANYAAMIHVKDGIKKIGVDGNPSVQYCLPGEGKLDLKVFLSSILRNKLERLPIYAEVSVQQSLTDGYDPRTVAKFCYEALIKASSYM